MLRSMATDARSTCPPAADSTKDAEGSATGDPGHDLLWVHSRGEDSRSWDVVRARDGELQVGSLRPVQEGKPLHGELLKLSPRSESPRLFDVETLYAPPKAANAAATRRVAAQTERRGPAQVSSDSYRSNWDAIWSSRRRSKRLPD